MSLPLPRRKRITTLNETAERILCRGDDFFKEAGERELLRLWQKYGDQLFAAHPANGTRCTGWWWFSSPRELRVARDGARTLTLLPTKQRQILVDAGLLHGAELETARRKIEEWKRSGKPMMFFDLCGR